MPAELHGFYFDVEKNRYFPIKHQAAGTSKIHNAKVNSPSLELKCRSNKRKRTHRFDTIRLLCSRELSGRLLAVGNQGNACFQKEYVKAQASVPKGKLEVEYCAMEHKVVDIFTKALTVDQFTKLRHQLGLMKIALEGGCLGKVWIYEDTNGRADGAVEQFCAIMETPQGRKEGNVLTMGGKNGWLSFYEIEQTGQELDYKGIIHQPRPFVSSSLDLSTVIDKQPSPIWSTMEPAMAFASNITAIKKLGKRSAFTDHDGIFLHEGALFTTLGSGRYGGSLYILRLNEPLDFTPGGYFLPLEKRVMECTSTNGTVWTADSNFDGTRAVIGTNQGVGLVDLETRRLSWVCRSTSDILSQQFDQSGNLVFCGFRNGVILTIDVRKRLSEHFEQSASVHRHAVPRGMRHFSSKVGHQHLLSGKFRVKGNFNPSDAIYTSSAVCSLTVLQSDDKYLLAGSMNGTIKLWDRRLVERGAVQSYEGHVNSHTTLQLGVDPTETLLASGGEDCAIRIWSIKTGELLHTAAGAASPVTTICWPKSGRLGESSQGSQFFEDGLFEQNFCWDLWLGSSEGLLYMHGGASSP